MIIVIGKEDRTIIQDAAAYVMQCGSYMKTYDKKHGKTLYADCNKIADRLFKAIRIKRNER